VKVNCRSVIGHKDEVPKKSVYIFKEKLVRTTVPTISSTVDQPLLRLGLSQSIEGSAYVSQTMAYGLSG
jgi:hypothetical protein